MGPLVSEESIRQSREALQAYAADKAAGTLKGRLILKGSGRDQKIVYDTKLKFHQSVRAKLFGTGPASLANVVDYCQKHKITCRELAEAAKEYNTSRVFFKKIPKKLMESLGELQGQKIAAITTVLQRKPVNLEALAKLNPTFLDLQMVGFTNLDEKEKVALLKGASKEREQNLVNAMVINLAYNPEFFSKVRPELQKESYDTLFDVLIRHGMNDAVKFVVDNTKDDDVDALITRRNSRGKTPLTEGGVYIKELLETKQKELISSQLKRYETEKKVKTGQMIFSSTVPDRSSQLPLLEWAMRFNKHCLAMKMIDVIGSQLNSEEVGRLLKVNPDNSIKAYMREKGLLRDASGRP